MVVFESSAREGAFLQCRAGIVSRFTGVVHFETTWLNTAKTVIIHHWSPSRKSAMDVATSHGTHTAQFWGMASFAQSQTDLLSN